MNLGFGVLKTSWYTPARALAGVVVGFLVRDGRVMQGFCIMGIRDFRCIARLSYFGLPTCKRQSFGATEARRDLASAPEPRASREPCSSTYTYSPTP